MILLDELGGLRQLAFVVNDAEATMKHLSGTLGIGPFHVIGDFIPDDFHYRGKASAPPRLTLAFAQCGPLQIEVIQQHNDVPSAYSEFLSTGREGPQHVAVWFDAREQYDAARARLLASGLTLVHENGPATSAPRFSYFDAGIGGGLMVELAEALVPAARPLIDLVTDSSNGWDGRDPIRKLEAVNPSR